MPFANTLDLVKAATGKGYAVPAINIVDPLTIKAVVEAADEVGSPVILQTSVKAVKSAGAAVLDCAAKDAAERASVGVSLHLDHCPDRAMITHVIESGWTSVLFDASDRDLAEARRETAEVVAEQTGADMLAPQLGTAHGMYGAQPVLLPGRVRELVALCALPIVLHGGTGLSDEEFDEFIRAGVTKINISTALKRAYMKSALDYLKQCEESNQWEPVKLFEPMIAASQELFRAVAETFHSVGQVAR